MLKFRFGRNIRVTVLAALALIILGAGIQASDAASAHSELLSAAPASGQIFADGIPAPSEVRLTFSEDILATGTVIKVVNASGDDVAVGETRVVGDLVTASLPTELHGDYQVRWRVVSADGHPIAGVIDFGVGSGATGKWQEPSAEVGGADSADASGDSESGEIAGVPSEIVVILIALALVIVVVAAVIFLVLRLGQRGQNKRANDTE